MTAGVAGVTSGMAMAGDETAMVVEEGIMDGRIAGGGCAWREGRFCTVREGGLCVVAWTGKVCGGHVRDNLVWEEGERGGGGGGQEGMEEERREAERGQELEGDGTMDGG